MNQQLKIRLLAKVGHFSKKIQKVQMFELITVANKHVLQQLLDSCFAPEGTRGLAVCDRIIVYNFGDAVKRIGDGMN